MQHFARIFGLFFFVALASGCVSTQPIGLAPTLEVAELGSLPPPSAQDYVASAEGSGQIRPLDKLEIIVFDIEELDREVSVADNGSFRYPLIGTVEAIDRTPAQIAVEIEDRLRGRFVLDPSVSVSFVERSGQTFSIGGEVDKPGQYTLPPSTSLLEAVSIGGGVTENAQLDDILIIRTIGGQRYIGVYNLRAIQRGNYEDPSVYAQDIVMVGESPTRRLLATVIGSAPLLTSFVILADRIGR